MSARRHTAALVPALLLATPLFAQSPPVREDLDALGGALESAVARVSRPSRSVVSSRAPRSYRLPGYGAMILLAPRPLPAAASPRAATEPQGARALAEAARSLEQSLRTVQSEEARQQLQRQLTALRETEALLRRRAAGEAAAPTAAPSAPAIAARDLATLERLMEEDMARQADAWQRSEGSRGEVDLLAQAEFDQQLRLFHDQAEAFRREAERAFHAAEQEVQQRMAPGAAAPSVAPTAIQPEAPPLSPWQSWFGVEEPPEAPGSPEAAVEGVRSAPACAPWAPTRPWWWRWTSSP
jgi:hypothetical protein